MQKFQNEKSGVISHFPIPVLVKNVQTEGIWHAFYGTGALKRTVWQEHTG